MIHYNHFQGYLKENGYHETLTLPQQADSYVKAYPGRTVPLIGELVSAYRESQKGTCGQTEFWFEHITEAVNYVERGIEPESKFLVALLKNNLMGACDHADGKLDHVLCDMVRTIHLWFPRICHGSSEAYATWCGQEAAELRYTVLSQSESKGWHEWKKKWTF